MSTAGTSSLLGSSVGLSLTGARNNGAGSRTWKPSAAINGPASSSVGDKLMRMKLQGASNAQTMVDKRFPRPLTHGTEWRGAAFDFLETDLREGLTEWT